MTQKAIGQLLGRVTLPPVAPWTPHDVRRTVGTGDLPAWVRRAKSLIAS